MDRNLIGTFISIAFVIVIIMISEILKKKGNWGNEATRKFIHIGVSHWWIIAMVTIPKIQYAIIPPIIFIILNYLSYKKDLLKSMERDGDKSDLGTVYFPISLLVIILLTWEGGLLPGGLKYLGAIGILVMGYGDGFAAIVGKTFGKNRYKILGSKKTLEGSLTMAIFSFMVTLLILTYFRGLSTVNFEISIIVAILAMILEGFTPFGLDNLSVPIITTLAGFYLISISDNAYILSFFLRVAVGFTVSSTIAYLAYYKKSLTSSGAIGAIVLGTGIFATGGIFSASLMVLFFISSSALSHYKKGKKEEVSQQFDKTGNRDITQVFANGGVGLIYSIIYYLTKDPLFLILIGISFAASNGDTWSTELGVLNNKEPISLRTFKRVVKGTSGAISGMGTFSGLLGALFIAFPATFIIEFYGISIDRYNFLEIFIIITLGGFLGGMIDSVLGATVQGIYYSDEVKKETERSSYNGKPNRLIKGFRFFNNDLVNFLSIGIASIVFYIIIR